MQQYNIIHFEALGEEAAHLKEEMEHFKGTSEIPKDFSYLITPENLQNYLAQHPHTVLPDIISIKTHSKLPEDYLKNGAKKSVITRSAGYDHCEHYASIANISSLREYCVEAVAQTAIKFLYNICGYANEYTEKTRVFEREKTHSFIELHKGLKATVFGVGKIGKKVYELLVANGLDVRAVDIREAELKKLYGDKFKFISKEEALDSDIFVNVMNLTKIEGIPYYNVNYFSKEYLQRATKKFAFINMTRGDIAPESGLLELYNNGKMVGFGTDVFSNESLISACLKANDFSKCQDKDVLAGYEFVKKSLDRSGNVYVQSHQAFNSDLAAASKASEAIKHLVAWIKNNKERFDEQLPYY